MYKFLNILNRKLTIGNLFTIIASFLFAITLRHLYIYFLEILPVKGGLEVSDISFLGLIIFFRFIFSVFLEYLLDDKFSIPLFGDIEYNSATPLSMVNSNATSSSSSNATPSSVNLTEEDRNRVKELIKRKEENDPAFRQNLEENRKFIEQQDKDLGKMFAVLEEQTDKLLKLSNLKTKHDIKLYQENEGLDLSVPKNMTDIEAQKLSKQVGALDRSLQNKFAEYRNLSNKDVRLYDSVWTSVTKGIWENNQKLYRELFEGNEDTKK